MNNEKANGTNKPEVDEIKREMNRLFIEDISKGRKIYLGLFVLLLALDIYRTFIMSPDSSSGHQTAVIIGYGGLSLLFLIFFLKTTSVVIDLPRWALLVVIVLALRIPFVMLAAILILDYLTYRKVKELKKEIEQK